MNGLTASFYADVYTIFGFLKDLQNVHVDQNVWFKDQRFILTDFEVPLCSIETDKITLINLDFSIGSKIEVNKLQLESTIELGQVKRFLQRINAAITGLNHCGVGYKCQSVEADINRYKRLINDSRYHLYEEKANRLDRRWLFLGDTRDENSSLFEIVLANVASQKPNNWFPHFQIDLDTTLTPDEVLSVCKKYFGGTFVTFALKGRAGGVVLYMGRLGISNGISIYLGIGTNLRNASRHRQFGLHKII